MDNANTYNNAAANAAPINNLEFEEAVAQCEHLLAQLFTSSCGRTIYTDGELYTAWPKEQVLWDSYQAEVDGENYRISVTANWQLRALLNASGWEGSFDVYINDNNCAPPVPRVTSWRCDGAQLQKLANLSDSIRQQTISQLLQHFQTQ